MPDRALSIALRATPWYRLKIQQLLGHPSRTPLAMRKGSASPLFVRIVYCVRLWRSSRSLQACGGIPALARARHNFVLQVLGYAFLMSTMVRRILLSSKAAFHLSCWSCCSWKTAGFFVICTYLFSALMYCSKRRRTIRITLRQLLPFRKAH